MKCWIPSVCLLLLCGAPLGRALSSGTTSLYADLGCGQAQYDYRESPENTRFTRRLVELEIGLRRPLRSGWPLRLGSSVALLMTPDRALGDSYSLLAFDPLHLEYAPRFPVRGRLGVGLLRVFAPVNELALGVTFAVFSDLGPLALGVKTRLARLEVDFEPHGTYPDTKYVIYYFGIAVTRDLIGN